MTTRAGSAYLWPLITDLVDGVIVNRQVLYDECLHRLQDYGLAVRDIVFGLRADLSSQAVGSWALLRGSVALGTLAFYDPIDTPLGSLDGLTLIITSDLAGPVTITFNQPTSPAAAVSQANIQGAALGITFAVDDGVDPVSGAIIPVVIGRLRMTRSGGSPASITVGAGTANGVLGLSATAVVGVDTLNDGASKIGMGAITLPTGWTGGTLRAFLEMVFVALDDVSRDTVDHTAADSAQSITATKDTFVKVVDFIAAPRTYAMQAPTVDGVFVWLRRSVPNAATVVTVSGLHVDDGSTIDLRDTRLSATLFSVSGAWRLVSTSAE
jgi:hypothetical protein